MDILIFGKSVRMKRYNPGAEMHSSLFGDNDYVPKLNFSEAPIDGQVKMFNNNPDDLRKFEGQNSRWVDADKKEENKKTEVLKKKNPQNKINGDDFVGGLDFTETSKEKEQPKEESKIEEVDNEVPETEKEKEDYENLSIEEKIKRALDEKQSNRQYKDHNERVGGSKKELATLRKISAEKILEQDSATQFKMITKEKVIPEFDLEERKKAGDSAGLVYLKLQLRSALTKKPENSDNARRLYVQTVPKLIELIDNAKSYEEIKQYGGFITPGTPHWGKKKEYYIHADDTKTDAKDVYGKRFLGLLGAVYEYRTDSHNWAWYNAKYKYDPYTTEDKEKEYYEAKEEHERFIKGIGKSPQNNVIHYLRGAKIDELNDLLGLKEKRYGFGREDIEKIRDKQPPSEREWQVYMRKVNEEYEDLLRTTEREYPDKYFELIDKLASKYYTDGYKLGTLEEYMNNTTGKKLRPDGDWSFIEGGEKKHDNQEEKKEEEKKEEESAEKKSIETTLAPPEMVIHKREPLTVMQRTNSRAVTEEEIRPEALETLFNFKSVQLGHYVKDGEAKVHIRRFIGSMKDLEDCLEIDIAQINKAGGLSIAFGARGSGSALAHYEPMSKIINLTKSRGDGSVAHEWAHFLDNFLSGGAGFATEGKAQNSVISSAMNEVMNEINRQEGNSWSEEYLVQPEIQWKYFPAIKRIYEDKDLTAEEKFSESVEYCNRHLHNPKNLKIGMHQIANLEGKAVRIKIKSDKTRYLRNAEVLGKKYWANPKELFARAFESYVQDKLEEKGMYSNYLVANNKTKAKAEAEEIENDKKFWAYPQGKERVAINEAIDDLLMMIKREYHFDRKPAEEQRINETVNLDDDVKKSVYERLNLLIKSLARPKPYDGPVKMFGTKDQRRYDARKARWVDNDSYERDRKIREEDYAGKLFANESVSTPTGSSKTTKIEEQKTKEYDFTGGLFSNNEQTPKETTKNIPQTETEEFKKWFGNSKVVDKNGKPLKVFHGTGVGDFSAFNPRQGPNGRIAKQQMDFGSHFTPVAEEANQYTGTKANARVYPAYLKIEKPLDLTKAYWEGDKDFDSILQFAKDIFGKRKELNMVIDYHDKYGKKTDRPQLVVFSTHVMDSLQPETLRQSIMERFDGVIYQPYIPTGNKNYSTQQSKSYIVFNPNQIKSATGNNGNFDINSDDITKSINPKDYTQSLFSDDGIATSPREGETKQGKGGTLKLSKNQSGKGAHWRLVDKKEGQKKETPKETTRTEEGQPIPQQVAFKRLNKNPLARGVIYNSEGNVEYIGTMLGAQPTEEGLEIIFRDEKGTFTLPAGKNNSKITQKGSKIIIKNRLGDRIEVDMDSAQSPKGTGSLLSNSPEGGIPFEEDVELKLADLYMAKQEKLLGEAKTVVRQAEKEQTQIEYDIKEIAKKFDIYHPHIEKLNEDDIVFRLEQQERYDGRMDIGKVPAFKTDIMINDTNDYKNYRLEMEEKGYIFEDIQDTINDKQNTKPGYRAITGIARRGENGLPIRVKFTTPKMHIAETHFGYDLLGVMDNIDKTFNKYGNNSVIGDLLPELKENTEKIVNGYFAKAYKSDFLESKSKKPAFKQSNINDWDDESPTEYEREIRVLKSSLNKIIQPLLATAVNFSGLTPNSEDKVSMLDDIISDIVAPHKKIIKKYWSNILNLFKSVNPNAFKKRNIFMFGKKL